MTTTRTRTRSARCCGNVDVIDRSDDSRRVRKNLKTDNKHKTNFDLGDQDAIGTPTPPTTPSRSLRKGSSSSRTLIAPVLLLPSPLPSLLPLLRAFARANKNHQHAAESTLLGQARRCPRCGCSCCSCCIRLATATCRARVLMVLTRARAKNRATRAPMPRAHPPDLTLPDLT